MHKISKKTIKSHDGLKLYYETHITDTEKPVLFFLHGIGGDLDAWDFIKNPLLELGFSAIAMDLRGHGHSGHPKSAESYNMKDLVQDVVAILRQERFDKIILIGHSFGTVVAHHFALDYPEKIEKLILISPIFHAPTYLRSKNIKKLAHKTTNFLAKISPRPIRPGHSKYPVGKFHKDYELFGLARTILRNSLKSYLLNSKITIDLDVESTAHQLQIETLIIAGDKDTVFPISSTKRIQAKIPHSKLKIIKGGNHVLVLNNAAAVANLISRFLLD